jgi:hypothetical protein
MKKILFVILILLVALVVFKDQIIKTAIPIGSGQVLGTPAEVDHFSVSFLRQQISIKGFRLYNPEGFPKEVFIDIPEITISFNVPKFLQGKMDFPLVVFNLKELIIYKNKEGKLNVDSLKIAQQKKTESAPAKKEQPKKPAKQMPLHIDTLSLNIGKVVVKDYSQGGEPTVQAYDVGIKNKVYKDINSPEQLATLVMLEAMGPTAIKSAGLTAAASVLGVAFLPAGVAGVLMGKDSSTADFSASPDQVYAAALDVAKKMGQVSKEDQAAGFIKFAVDGANVTIEIKPQPENKTSVDVSARKMMLPKPEIAGGVLYNISEKLK